MSDLDEYPNPRKAIFGNGHVANLRCAVKYIGWQFIYVVGAVLMLLAVGSVRAAQHAYAALPTRDTIPNLGVSDAVESGISSVVSFFGQRHVKKKFELLTAGVTVLAVLVGISWGVYEWVTYALNHTDQYFWYVGYGLHIVVGATLIALAGAALFILSAEGWKQYVRPAAERLAKRLFGTTKKGAARGAKTYRTVTTTAKKTKGARRVYGNCPVDIDLRPKWFEGLKDRLDIGDEDDE